MVMVMVHMKVKVKMKMRLIQPAHSGCCRVSVCTHSSIQLDVVILGNEALLDLSAVDEESRIQAQRLSHTVPQVRNFLYGFKC